MSDQKGVKEQVQVGKFSDFISCRTYFGSDLVEICVNPDRDQITPVERPVAFWFSFSVAYSMPTESC